MDIKALMAKRAQLTTKTNENLFKPTEGDTLVRIVPLKSNPDNPFQELFFHYFNKKTQLSPLTYGERDPSAELSEALRLGKDLPKEEWKEAIKLMPQARYYAPVVVRGKEAEGVKFWGFSKSTYTAILDIIADEDYGDITDVMKGHDLRVTMVPAEKSATKFAEIKVAPKPKSSKLTDDEALLQKLTTEQPNLIDMWPKQSYEDIKNALDIHLGIGVTGPASAPVAPDVAKAVDEEWAETPAPKAPAVDAEVRKGGAAKTPAVKSVEDEFADIYNDA